MVDSMEITAVKVNLVLDEAEKRLKAFANIIFDDCFVVSGLKVIRGDKGLFVSMPSRKLKDGTFKDIAHPLNNETRKLIEDKVLAAYEEKLKEPRPEEPKARVDEF
jgi:stage V sporulation protein G